MRVKLRNRIIFCIRIEKPFDNMLKIKSMENVLYAIECIDHQEAEDLYYMAYEEGCIDVSNRSYSFVNE